MADSDGTTAYHLDELIKALQEKPYEFGFYQALRLIECHYKDRPRLGKSKRPVDDPIRLSQVPSLTFESSSLAEFDPGKDGKPHRLKVRMLGLLGPNGPLPLFLTEFVQERQRKFNDQTFAKFLDIFHHRMLSLFYRAWANNEPTISFDRPESDRFSDYVGSLIGLGIPALRKRDNIPDNAKFYYSGRLSCQVKCAGGLQAMLADYFSLSVEIQEFVGEWLELPQKHVCQLGVANSTLCESLILGSRIWGSQHKFRIKLGPLNAEAYERFLPIGDKFRGLVTLVRNYVGDELAWDVNLILKWEDIPELCLDGKCRLGWTTYLGKRSDRKDANDLILNAFNYLD